MKKFFFFVQTMTTLASEAVNNSAIDELVQSSLESINGGLRLEWIPSEKITDVMSVQSDNVYYAIRKYTSGEVKETTIMLLFLGNSKECAPTLVSEFARIYSL